MRSFLNTWSSGKKTCLSVLGACYAIAPGSPCHGAEPTEVGLHRASPPGKMLCRCNSQHTWDAGSQQRARNRENRIHNEFFHQLGWSELLALPEVPLGMPQRGRAPSYPWNSVGPGPSSPRPQAPVNLSPQPPLLLVNGCSAWQTLTNFKVALPSPIFWQLKRFEAKLHYDATHLSSIWLTKRRPQPPDSSRWLFFISKTNGWAQTFIHVFLLLLLFKCLISRFFGRGIMQGNKVLQFFFP